MLIYNIVQNNIDINIIYIPPQKGIRERGICQFYDFPGKYFIKNSYSVASWGALASKIETGAKFRTFWHREGSVAHNLGGVSSLFRPTLTSCMMCRDHILYPAGGRGANHKNQLIPNKQYPGPF